MKIRLATSEDINSILDLAEVSRGIMRRDGNLTQWADTYPHREIIESDIAQGYGRLCEVEGRAVAYFALMPGSDPTYSKIEAGQWLDDVSPYLVIHRLMSDGARRGVFAQVMNYCRGLTKNLRADTHADNRIMRRCLEREGFVYCGIIYVHNGSPRRAYQCLWLG